MIFLYKYVRIFCVGIVENIDRIFNLEVVFRCEYDFGLV